MTSPKPKEVHRLDLSIFCLEYGSPDWGLYLLRQGV